ncbi:isocitrate lyase/PEP mutase family protein [Pseudonocardia sp. GCM10023141]|uniref:isocitrate lyase/PEP mutase family protein n=1 Tax=Pseudonocardia sp. GCM10023141 TaxID=3252653 RepID=UPI003617C8C6
MTTTPAAALRARLADPAAPQVRCPGATDGLAARLAAAAGFESLYVSGAGASAARGLPDMGLLSLTELIDAVHVVADAAGLPVVVDGDTGYGDIVAIRRTLRELAAAGAAAVHLEDQPFPRRCGYLTAEPCVPIAEMLRRLDAARAADSGLVLIARTDSLLTEGIEATVERAKAYAGAGVDLLMINGVRAVADLERVHEATGFPMLHNVSGSDRTPALSDAEARSLDVRISIWPIQAARAATLAVQRYFAALAASTAPPELMGFTEYMDLAGWADADAFEDAIARGAGPADDDRSTG